MDEESGSGKSKYVVVFSLVVALGIVAFGVNTIMGYATTMQGSAAADSYTSQVNANSNYGTATAMYAKLDYPFNQNKYSQSYLKFDISSLPANSIIDSAKLKVYITSVYKGTPYYNPLMPTTQLNKISDDTWTEGGITWSNQPASAGAISSQNPTAAGWAEFDITSYVTSEYGGDKKASFMLKETGACSYSNCVSNDKVGVEMGTKENSGKEPKLEITYHSSDSTAPSAITDFGVKSETTDSLTLGWTATGDDGTTGTASTQSMWYSTSQFSDTSSWFAGATTVALNAPKASGSAEEKAITGLAQSTTYYFALKVADEVGNTPGYATTYHSSDSTAPSAIADFSVKVTTTRSLSLGWTATGDDGTTGTASTQSMWYSTSQFSDTSSWFAGATTVALNAPKASGSAEEKAITGLAQSTTYYFALKVADEVGNTPGYATTSGTTETPIPPSIAITIVSPEAGKNYTTNHVLASIGTDKIADACNVSLNGGVMTSMTQSGNLGWWMNMTGLPEGENAVEFKCFIGSANDTKTVKFGVDTQAPQITSISQDLSEPTKGQKVTAKATVSDRHYPVIASFWDSYTNTTTSPVPYLKGEEITHEFDTASVPFDTIVKWKVIVKDSLGNSREGNETAFTVKPTVAGPAISAAKQSRDELKEGEMLTLSVSIYDDYEFSNITLFVSGKPVETRKLEGHNASIDFAVNTTNMTLGAVKWSTIVFDNRGYNKSSEEKSFTVKPAVEPIVELECDEKLKPNETVGECEGGQMVTEMPLCDKDTGKWKIKQTIEACEEEKEDTGVIVWVSIATVIAIVGAGIALYLLKKPEIMDLLKGMKEGRKPGKKEEEEEPGE